MKRTIVIILSIISSVVLIVVLALFIRIYFIPVLNIGDSQTNNPETFLMVSQSPDGKYTLEGSHFSDLMLFLTQLKCLKIQHYKDVLVLERNHV